MRVAVPLGAAGLLAGVLAALLLPPLPLPVTADLQGPGGDGTATPLAAVAGRAALPVPAALAVLALLLLPRFGVPPGLAAVGAASPVAVFLVAQLNGVRDLGALVLVYAATAGAVLVRTVPGRWPWSVAAMLGIVPWGVVAAFQVGATLAGGVVPAGVRVLTLVVLAATVLEFVRSGPAERPRPALVVLPAALLSAGSLLL